MNDELDYEALKDMDWQEVVKIENSCDMIRDLGEGWWLFQRKGNEGYHGVLGWLHRSYKFYARHNPAEIIKHNIADFGYRKDERDCFTDGRSIKWVTRAFLPPSSNAYSKKVIQEVGALNLAEIAELERLQKKLEGLLISGSDQHKAAMKVAKTNREALRKKWTGKKQGKKLPPQPIVPEHITKTLIFLNGENE